MTKEEFEDLDRSIVRFKNIHGEHIRALVCFRNHISMLEGAEKEIDNDSVC